MQYATTQLGMWVQWRTNAALRLFLYGVLVPVSAIYGCKQQMFWCTCLRIYCKTPRCTCLVDKLILSSTSCQHNLGVVQIKLAKSQWLSFRHVVGCVWRSGEGGVVWLRSQLALNHSNLNYPGEHHELLWCVVWYQEGFFESKWSSKYSLPGVRYVGVPVQVCSRPDPLFLEGGNVLWMFKCWFEPSLSLFAVLQALSFRHKLQLSEDEIHSVFREADLEYRGVVRYEDFLDAFTGEAQTTWAWWMLWNLNRNRNGHISPWLLQDECK